MFLWSQWGVTRVEPSSSLLPCTDSFHVGGFCSCVVSKGLHFFVSRWASLYCNQIYACDNDVVKHAGHRCPWELPACVFFFCNW